MNTTEKFPFDFEILNKGSVISTDTLEKASGISRTSRKFSLVLLQYAREVEDYFRFDRGVEVIVRTDNDQISILLDVDADEFSEKMFDEGLKKVRRWHRKTLSIDTSGFAADRLSNHHRRCVVQGAQVVAMRKAGRVALRAEASRRPLALSATIESGAQVQETCPETDKPESS
jgi:hypothetical protein